MSHRSAILPVATRLVAVERDVRGIEFEHDLLGRNPVRLDEQIVPLADGQDYAAKIPHSRLVVIPECGHAPSLETPREFVAAVETFLKP